MVDRVMTAEARIQARDMTGRVFEQVGKKLKKLSEAQKAINSGGDRGVGKVVDRHVGAMGRITSAANAAGPAIAAGAAAGVRKFASDTVETYREFDKLRRYQKAILHLSDSEQKPLVDQAIHMGGSTRFNDIQVLEAQTDLAQRGIKRDVIIPITDAAASFATAMGTDLPEAAKTLEGIIFSTGKNVENGAQAITEANRVASFATKLAKIGGLDAEDIKQYFKYGGQPGAVAGFSDPTMGAMAALMRRSNIRGDEAGVATRAISGKLVAPTSKGIAAMSAVGVDYNKYTKMPGGLSSDALEGNFKRDLGKGFSPAVRKKIDEINNNSELVSDRGAYTEAVTDAVSPLFEKNKKGKMKAQDRHAVAKSVGQFHKYSAESVDSEGLLRALIGAHMTLAQSNAVFGQQQGGRFLAVAQHGLPLFDEYFKNLAGAGDDFHKQIAEERNQGFDAAVTRFDGAVKNLETALGRSNDSWMTGGADAMGKLIQHLAESDDGVLKFATAVGGAATAVATFETALGALGIMQKVTGGDAAALGVGGGFLARMGFYGKLGVWGLMAYLAYQMAEKDGPAAVQKNSEDRGKDSESGLKAQLDQIETKINAVAAQPDHAGDMAALRAQEMDLLGRLAEIEQRKADKPIDVTGKITATVDKPVDITGREEISTSAQYLASAEAFVFGFQRTKISESEFAGVLPRWVSGAIAASPAKTCTARRKYAGSQAMVSNAHKTPVCLYVGNSIPLCSSKIGRISSPLPSSICSRAASKGSGAASASRGNSFLRLVKTRGSELMPGSTSLRGW